MNVISRETYNDLRAKINAFDQYVDEHFRKGRKKQGWAVYAPGDVPLPSVSNEQRSQVELYEFCHNRPSQYVCYIKLDGPKAKTFTAVTWGGDTLGRGVLLKPRMVKLNQSTIAARRWGINFAGINGLNYEGTYYSDKGDFAKVKAVK